MDSRIPIVGTSYRVIFYCCHSNIVCPPRDNIHTGTCAFTIGTSEDVWMSWFGVRVCGFSCPDLQVAAVPPWSCVSAVLYTVAVVAGLELKLGFQVPASLMAHSQ